MVTWQTKNKLTDTERLAYPEEDSSAASSAGDGSVCELGVGRTSSSGKTMDGAIGSKSLFSIVRFLTTSSPRRIKEMTSSVWGEGLSSGGLLHFPPLAGCRGMLVGDKRQAPIICRTLGNATRIHLPSKIISLASLTNNNVPRASLPTASCLYYLLLFSRPGGVAC